MSKTIAIVTHKHQGFLKQRYFLSEIASIWREEGIDVCVISDPETQIDADIAILHVDLTVVPHEYIALSSACPIALNFGVHDISKRAISSNIIARDSAYAGPVIVKTNLNHGGMPEKALRQKSRDSSRPVGIHLTISRHWGLEPYLSPHDYRVLASSKEVPAEVWSNPALVVEQFLPERHEDYYCLRTWVFLGESETNSISYSRAPIVKSSNTVHREKVAEVPEGLRQMRRDLKFDFGKFDYAIVNGRTVLYDANRTPNLGNFSRELFLPNLKTLAEGIRKYL